MQCPLCRTNWGDKGLEMLKENTKEWREQKTKKAVEDRPKILQALVPSEDTVPQND